ncbi:MAG: DUF3791 domain-containing protein [Peptococcaceae bacterium]|nr:DUF3791 domain-containing protein [Peptococcaceae bacterium]MBQ3509684.1 DUF3791 domain-containing protein [Peptococcaceae bacterium]
MKSEIQNANEMEYIIFCIENVAAKLEIPAETVYAALTEKSDILDRYIIPNYEILHTQDKGYIVDDILSVMQEEGVEV